MGKSPGLRLQAALVQDNVPVAVAPRLFVGSIHAAFNVDALRELGITHVLNLAGGDATFPDDFTYLCLSIRDKDYANLLSCLPVARLFIDAALGSGPTSDHDKDKDGVTGSEPGGVLIHCAGGRSRSPAVAIAFLMMRDGLSFDQALERVRGLRPVVALNAGFEAQLRFLDDARGDVFAAHQRQLHYQLATLAQQRADGLLDPADLARRGHRQHHQHHQRHQRHHRHPNGRHHHHHHQDHHHQRPPSESSPRAKTATDGGGEPVPAIACCDERGMLHGRVPSGFSLSQPASPRTPAFIPALRSMGTLFGCRACGENLFSASAVVTHAPTAAAITHVPDGAGKAIALDADAAVAPKSSTTTKRPLLAKLRLRPHSPSVVGEGKKAATDARDKPRDSPGGTPRASVLKGIRKDGAGGDRAESSFWRSLRALGATRRGGDRPSTGSNSSSPSSSRAAAEDKAKKPGVDSPTAIDLAPGDSDEDRHHRAFLEDNARQWERKIRGLASSLTSDPALSADLDALLAQDQRALDVLACDAWFVEAQPWALAQALEAPTGTIRCPNERCAAVLGQWHWDGLACACGGSVRPAFQLQRSHLRDLGNVVAPVPERQVAGDADAFAPPGEVGTPTGVPVPVLCTPRA